MEVGRVSGSFILRSCSKRRLFIASEELDGGGACVRELHPQVLQQEEALHRIWYALKRWRLISRWTVLFPTMACSSINRR
ncbi:unnamed protein product [Spirodela intermedia]|uniref:Uncharacterized protein n=2 Tax=Spirodela intermedia TaxID=51605 RepID=A0A7I8ILG6_SPIIN|nr:unnamed protein product [Spirodela intermedia]CAA6658586.1 unnamed protein product [Spirodela intermedia]CAA7393083.1 unnamed protein product [Spirodela intermedia]